MFKVTAYLEAGTTHVFSADNKEKAREIANRVIREGLWVVTEDHELFVPNHRVFKVKVEALG